MTDKKELVLRLPEHIFQVIKTHKEVSGVSYTNFIYNAVYWYMVCKKMISLPYSTDTKLFPANWKGDWNTAPSEVMYCDSDKCELPVEENYHRTIEGGCK